MEKISLLGLEKNAIRKAFAEHGYEPWRANQVWLWIYGDGAKLFDEMSNLPLSMRKELADKFAITRPDIVKHEFSSDGTEKIAIKMIDGDVVEMVFIPDEERGTLCVSSQVGCPVRCSFCYTGTQGFSRDLTAAEIVGQILLMRDLLADKGRCNQKRVLTNIVMMGMGEPLHNYSNVSTALKIVMAPDGLAFSKRRITLSTAGVVPLIQRCGEELGVNLAISLHAANNKIRDSIMPINKQYPLEKLIEACRSYPGINQMRRLTFEYVMLSGVNDSDNDAKSLVRLVAGLPAKFNLIPWNPWPGASFQSSSQSRMDSFAKILMKAGYTAIVRIPRGRDISAACGQLRTNWPLLTSGPKQA
ncbi:MAG: 23S rRNA (adenine(2503)-C(2))-methyltransferase RlmN [Holosporales bacterium]|jgi:23S rRNA (adenine2503-C2)-methyltransferase|nr:23S rRNA (adenine(2503)-C(2))-methyltransferase RlmN [Holosporales bacterium]